MHHARSDHLSRACPARPAASGRSCVSLNSSATSTERVVVMFSCVNQTSENYPPPVNDVVLKPIPEGR
jgi:hypothetical protein